MTRAWPGPRNMVAGVGMLDPRDKILPRQRAVEPLQPPRKHASYLLQPMSLRHISEFGYVLARVAWTYRVDSGLP